MADDDQDQEQKTEQPTPKRLEEALKKGNVPHSRELGNFLLLALIATTITWFAPMMFKNTRILLLPFLADADILPTDQDGLGHLLGNIMLSSVGIVAAPLIGTIVVALGATFLQNGFLLSNEPLMPKLSRISPLAGLKRIFSMRSVVEFLKSVLKMIIVGYVGFIAIFPELGHIRQLSNTTTDGLLVYILMLAMRMTIGITIAMFFLALFDIIYQRFQYIKSLRMTRQEVRDEYKQSEGDPMVKQRLRRLRHERARKRMMSAVPKADVVITNPTHFAIALQYDSKNMKAPIVIAKGQDKVAFRIREVAEKNSIPIVENAPLARALYSSTEIDDEIPLDHYEAVAKIISYVYQLKGRKL